MITNTYQRMPGDPLRWGILGTGFIASLQTRDLIENGFAVQAVGSRTLGSSRSFCDKFSIPTAHESYEALVADPSVDVVYVATPHIFHHAHAMLALTSGKHVLVEKPFTINAHQAREIIALAETKGLVVLEAMWSRFLPHMVRLREIINNGLLGEVRKIIADHNQNLPKDPTHRLNDPALGGGALLDLGIYPVSLAFDVFGAPESVRASAAMTETGVDRQTAVILNIHKGSRPYWTAPSTQSGPIAPQLSAPKDGLTSIPSGIQQQPSPGMTRTATPWSGSSISVNGRGMQFQAAEIVRLIEAGSTAGDILPPSESVAVMAAMDEIRRQIGLSYEADTFTATSANARS